MSRSVAVLLWTLGLLAALALVAVWFLAVNTGPLESRAESHLSELLGTDVELRGGMRVRPLPSPRAVLRDVVAGDDVSVEEIELDLAPLSMLRGGSPVRSVTLRQPEVFVRRTDDGRVRVAGLRAGDNGAADGFTLASVQATDARLTVFDADEDGLLLDGCDLSLESLHLDGGDAPVLRRLSFDGEVSCDRARHGPWTTTGVSVGLSAADGVIDADPVSLELLGGDASGQLVSDFSADPAVHRLSFEFEAFSVEAFLERLIDERIVEGTLAMQADLSSEGLGGDELRRNLAGTVVLHGRVLKLHGVDLDELVSDYESATAFDLFDVAAALLVGPLGLAVTQGRDYAQLLSDSGEYTEVDQLHSAWTLDGGVARATDVALRTPGNLVAMHGGLDFGERRFDDVTVAVVDASGCAIVEQSVSGSFDEPEVDSPSVLETLAEPAVDLLERAAELFGADGCEEPFYEGSMGHPRNDD